MSRRIHPRRLAVAQRLRVFFAALAEELAGGTDRIYLSNVIAVFMLRSNENTRVV
jgi:hypothetical protein